MYNMEKCGARIKDLRNSRKITQEALAGKLFISRDHLRRVETGKKGASIDLLIDIAELFDVSLDYLICGKTYEIEQMKRNLSIAINMLTQIIKRL